MKPFLFVVGFLLLALGSACDKKQKTDKSPSEEEFPRTGEKPVVVVETSKGSFKIELFQDDAPITVKNFLKYVDAKHYDGTIFHRVIKGFMVQGGGMTPNMNEKATNPPIKNESGNGISNKRGTVAMARTPDPNSATAQFFVNVVDNDFLDRAKAKDKAGYAVFGRVIDGMDVVDDIRFVETANDVPVQVVEIKSIRREDKK